MKIELTLSQLRHLLNQQKLITIEKLVQSQFYYRADENKPSNIDKDKFQELGLRSDYPNDVEVLHKYINEQP